MRVEITSPPSITEANWIRVLLQQMAYLERENAGLNDDEVMDICKDLADSLMRDRRFKAPHIPFSLNAQRNELLKYLERGGYEPIAPEPQDQWLEDHKHSILLLVRACRCVCTYLGPRRYGPVPPSAAACLPVDRDASRQTEQIKNLLKPKPYFTRR
jgi:hypothetical protein